MQLHAKNSINVSRRQFVQYKRQNVFCVFTYLGLTRFYREPSILCNLMKDLCAVRLQKFVTLMCDVLLEALSTGVICANVEGFSLDALYSCLWLQANLRSAPCALVSLTNPIIYLCLIWIGFVSIH